MDSKNVSFSSLFKKYRLRSEIETLAQFGDLMAEGGLVYENSLYTHWQKGDRTPGDRKVLISVITLFVRREGISKIGEANNLLFSANMPPLTQEEAKRIGLEKKHIRKDRNAGEDLVEEKIFMRPHQNNVAIWATGFYTAILIWWIFLNLYHIKDTPINYAYAFSFGLIPLAGGVYGILSSFQKLQKSIYRSVFFFSAGLLSWGLGEMLWSVYNFFFNIALPYPSLCDVGFIVSWPLWGIGLYYLARATSTPGVVKKKYNKLSLLAFSLSTILITYYLIVVVARDGSIVSHSNPLIMFFDLVYPIMDIILITEAVYLYRSSFMYVRTKFRAPILLLLITVAVNFFGDFGFSYSTKMGTYFNGHIVDMTFATAFFLCLISLNKIIQLAVIAPYEVVEEERGNNNSFLPYERHLLIQE